MEKEVANALIALVFTGIIGGILKIYFDYKSKLMENVWEKRLEAYINFIKLTALFPLYPRKKVKWKDVYNLSISFRDWYFKGYGIVVSTEFRDKYLNFQKYIRDITEDEIESEENLTDKEYDDLKDRCFKLRSLMAKELESRESPIWYRFTKEKKI